MEPPDLDHFFVLEDSLARGAVVDTNDGKVLPFVQLSLRGAWVNQRDFKEALPVHVMPSQARALIKHIEQALREAGDLHRELNDPGGSDV